MKQLTCEMCGSIDLIKQDGVFVCQHCGCKYSVEEAKKMMIEGTVDVTGTVKIDKTERLENLYELARRAKKEDNKKNAVKYYDLILMEEPDNWEAAFYSTFFSVAEATIPQIKESAEAVMHATETVIHLIHDEVSDEDAQKNAVAMITLDTLAMANPFYTAANNYYNGIAKEQKNQYLQEYVSNVFAVVSLLQNLGDQIDTIFKEDPAFHQFSLMVWKEAITKHNSIMTMLIKGEENKQIILSYVKKVQKYEPTYVEPHINMMHGCYIATAVYGSYDCPQVWTLRRYRDDILAKRGYGRLWIHIYYAISPTFVKFFGETHWFKYLWRMKLDHLVLKLQDKGIPNTPYEDKMW